MQPSGLNLLPPELQNEVLRNTAAEFTVDWLTTFSYNFKDVAHNTWYNGIAVVNLCYEFKLERMRARGQRVLRARFTRGVSPYFKRSDPEWLKMGQAQQTAIEKFVARTAIIEPFLELRVMVHENPDARSSRFSKDLSHLLCIGDSWIDSRRMLFRSYFLQLKPQLKPSGVDNNNQPAGFVT